MQRKPMESARSSWVPAANEVAEALGGRCWHRRVGDGLLAAIVTTATGWHLSISFRDHKGRPSRYPRWDEIADARYQLIPDEVTMCLVLPPPGDYIALHDTTFQLSEHARPAPS
jgi:hypothetical protein